MIKKNFVIVLNKNTNSYAIGLISGIIKACINSRDEFCTSTIGGVTEISFIANKIVFKLIINKLKKYRYYSFIKEWKILV